MACAGLCEQTRAGGKLVASKGGWHSETRSRVEETSAPFVRLKLRAMLLELEKAQVSSSPQVLTGRSWGGAGKEKGGRIVGGKVREKE